MGKMVAAGDGIGVTSVLTGDSWGEEKGVETGVLCGESTAVEMGVCIGV